MLLRSARYIFDKNFVENRESAWAPLTTGVLTNTIDSRLENLLERPAMPAYARSHIVPPDEVGVYHCMARCLRKGILRCRSPHQARFKTAVGRPDALAALAARRRWRQTRLASGRCGGNR
jgi:hypothetical protein